MQFEDEDDDGSDAINLAASIILGLAGKKTTKTKETTMHPATESLMKFFSYDHLPEHLRAASGPVCRLADTMANTMPQNAELTVGLRKLLEAKDCFVRAQLQGEPPVNEKM